MPAPTTSLRYFRNRAFYNLFRRAPSAQELHQPAEVWDVSGIPRALAVESPKQGGLWLIRGCLDLDAAARIKALFVDLHRRSVFHWNHYEPGRDMMPLHAHPPLEMALTKRVICGLDVFGPPGSRGADPLARWPLLGNLLAEEAIGAAELHGLQVLPQKAIARFADEPCLFVQAQSLECGAEVTPHRDALPFGGDMIATYVIEGSSDVRVGAQRFRVDAGDMYAIADEARYDVEHEVMAAPYDRLSVTFRYGLGFPAELPPLPGEAQQRLACDRGGRSAIWDA